MLISRFKAGEILLLTLITLVPAHAFASLFAAAIQPPETIKRVDYRDSDAATTRRVHVVEQYHWQPALQCLAASRTRCAEQNLSFILNWVPNHPYALMKMSALEIRLGKAKRADTYLDNAVLFAPTDPAVYVVYGIHLQRSHRLPEAIEKYKKALKLDPNQSDAHYNLGLAYIDTGDLEKANEQAQIAYKLGYGLPGLRDQLQQRGAWKPGADAKSAKPQASSKQ